MLSYLKSIRSFAKIKTLKKEYSPLRRYTGTGVVEQGIQIAKNVLIAKLEDKIGSIGIINRTLRVVRYKVHIGLKVSPSERHSGGIPRIELTNLVKENKNYFSDWKPLNFSVPPKRIPFYMA